MKFWRNILLAVVLVWGVAFAVVYFVRKARPTAQSLADYIAKHPLAGQTGAARAKNINHVSDLLNGISFEDRQTLQRNGVTRDFFKELTPDEQADFLDATLPSGFKQMMDAFNKMDPEKRRKFVERALEEVKKHEGEAPPPGFDDKMAKKMVDQGLHSFYSDASADVKLDLAPLIEQMQRNLQSMH
ncbi:MAG: hypothetical protein WCH43_06015 [Verrucomicrobiota bacterium]